jgi:hypothetical protein
MALRGITSDAESPKAIVCGYGDDWDIELMAMHNHSAFGAVDGLWQLGFAMQADDAGVFGFGMANSEGHDRFVGRPQAETELPRVNPRISPGKVGNASGVKQLTQGDADVWAGLLDDSLPSNFELLFKSGPTGGMGNRGGDRLPQWGHAEFGGGESGLVDHDEVFEIFWKN